MITLTVVPDDFLKGSDICSIGNPITKALQRAGKLGWKHCGNRIIDERGVTRITTLAGSYSTMIDVIESVFNSALPLKNYTFNIPLN